MVPYPTSGTCGQWKQEESVNEIIPDCRGPPEGAGQEIKKRPTGRYISHLLLRNKLPHNSRSKQYAFIQAGIWVQLSWGLVFLVSGAIIRCLPGSHPKAPQGNSPPSSSPPLSVGLSFSQRLFPRGPLPMMSLAGGHLASHQYLPALKRV